MKAEEVAVKKAFCEFVKTPEFVKYYNDLHVGPGWRLVVAGLAFVVIFTAPITLYQLIRFLQEKRRRDRARNEIINGAEKMVPILAHPVMVNRALLEQPGSTAPGLVIATFDRAVSDSLDFMRNVLGRINDIQIKGPKNPDEQKLVAILEDTKFTAGRRRILPKSLTNGSPVFAFDLMIPGAALPGEPFRENFIICCMADPGPEGQAIVCPAHIARKALKDVDA